MALPLAFYGASLALSSPLAARVVTSPVAQRALPQLQRSFSKSVNTIGQSMSNAADNLTKAVSVVGRWFRDDPEPEPNSVATTRTSEEDNGTEYAAIPLVPIIARP